MTKLTHTFKRVSWHFLEAILLLKVMLCHTIAAHFRTDPIHTRELRAYAVDEVKRTNGQVSFESAVRSQRRIEPDDTWPGSY